MKLLVNYLYISDSRRSEIEYIRNIKKVISHRNPICFSLVLKSVLIVVYNFY